MTPDQIISEIWELTWYQAMKVAIYDDFIMMCKIWPVYAFMVVGFGLYLLRLPALIY